MAVLAPPPVPADRLPDALGCLEGLPTDIHLFLDYDGVLAPIVDDPAQAWPAPAARSAVARLSQHVPVTVVTGRDRQDATALLDVPSVQVIGGHGLDTGDSDLQAPWQPALQRVARRLHDELDLEGIHAGVRIEEKQQSIACHFRLQPRHEAAVTSAVRRAMEDEPGLRLLRGHMVLEVRPDVPTDKGSVVLDLLKGGRHGIYIGDDVTDEDAFRALATRGGTGIVVADDDRATHARMRLARQADVALFLDRLCIHVAP